MSGIISGLLYVMIIYRSLHLNVCKGTNSVKVTQLRFTNWEKRKTWLLEKYVFNQVSNHSLLSGFSLGTVLHWEHSLHHSEFRRNRRTIGLNSHDWVDFFLSNSSGCLWPPCLALFRYGKTKIISWILLFNAGSHWIPRFWARLWHRDAAMAPVLPYCGHNRAPAIIHLQSHAVIHVQVNSRC